MPKSNVAKKYKCDIDTIGGGIIFSIKDKVSAGMGVGKARKYSVLYWS